MLFVTVREGSGTGEREVVTHLRSRLAKHLVPREVRLVDHLPLNQNGKVVKTALRDLARAPAHPAPAAIPSDELVATGGGHPC